MRLLAGGPKLERLLDSHENLVWLLDNFVVNRSFVVHLREFVTETQRNARFEPSVVLASQNIVQNSYKHFDSARWQNETLIRRYG